MWKLGVVSFLNSLPLYHTLASREDVFIIKAVPSKLANLLDAGECDAALLPIVDHLRGHGSGVVSNACIGADGAVTSVMLFSKRPVQEIRTLAADTSSHSSVALLRILFRDFYHINPTWHNAAPDISVMLSSADAALLIGDPALEVFLQPGGLFVTDLAAAWKELTGLPFVFAAWTARDGLSADARNELAQLLNIARDEGTSQVHSLAHKFARPPLLDSTAVEDYLTSAIKFRLTAQYQQAIKEFARRLHAGP